MHEVDGNEENARNWLEPTGTVALAKRINCFIALVNVAAVPMRSRVHVT